jgi:hypothetical protein
LKPGKAETTIMAMMRVTIPSWMSSEQAKATSVQFDLQIEREMRKM